MDETSGTKLRDFVDPNEKEMTSFDETPVDVAPVEEAAGPRFAIPNFLKAQTGPGDIEDYIQHPLNFGKSRGIAQMLRGLTGMVGELKYAVIDIVMGAMQFSKERRAAATVKMGWLGGSPDAASPAEGH